VGELADKLDEAAIVLVWHGGGLGRRTIW
jgi:hypothetical protein